MLSAANADDVSIRAICDRANVTLPTLYHYFGDKAGLIDQVVAHGFETYLSEKRGHAPVEDPLEAIRQGWDQHVAFGLEYPGFYTVMYGRTRPGNRPSSASEAEAMLLLLARHAGEKRLLRVSPERATAMVLATNIGVTLALLTQPPAQRDLSLSPEVREAVLEAISIAGAAVEQSGSDSIAGLASTLRDTLAATNTALDPAEIGMLDFLLRRLGSH